MGDSDRHAAVRQQFVRSRFGWYCHTTCGVMHVGEVPLFSFTERGIRRKAARLVRHVRADEQARRFEVLDG